MTQSADRNTGDSSGDSPELDWQKIMNANPQLLMGRYNPDRKKLLHEGVFIALARRRAESWIPELRIMRATAEKVAQARGETVQQSDIVHVKIMHIPEETQQDVVDGKILVEADGIQAEIYASLIYNSIGVERSMPDIIVSDGLSWAGWGTAVPTRGDTSHSTFHRSRDT